MADFGGVSGTLGVLRVATDRSRSGRRYAGRQRRNMIALNKKTGEIVKKFTDARRRAAGYSSIIIVDAAGARQYVQFLAKGVVGIDPNPGKFCGDTIAQRGKAPRISAHRSSATTASIRARIRGRRAGVAFRPTAMV